MQLNNHLILVRGLPGTGKTTFARAMFNSDVVVFDPDTYLIKNGKYNYSEDKLKQVRADIKLAARDKLVAGQNVVITDTFITHGSSYSLRRMVNDELAYLNIKLIVITFKPNHPVGHHHYNEITKPYFEHNSVHPIPHDEYVKMCLAWED